MLRNGMTTRFHLSALLALMLLLCASGISHAQDTGAKSTPSPAANTVGLTPAEAKRAVDVLQDPQQRSQLIQTLQAISKALPPPPGDASASSPSTPATPAAPAAAVPAQSMSLAPDSLGAQLVSQFSNWPDWVAAEAATTFQAITDFPLLVDWARQIAADPEQRGAVLRALTNLALVIAVALAVGWLVRLALARPLRGLIGHAPKPPPKREAVPDGTEPAVEAETWLLLPRLPFALARLTLELIPVAVFWGIASLLSGLTPGVWARSAILIVANAYATTLLILAIGRMLVSPSVKRLRLLHVSDATASYLMLWLRRIVATAVFGSAFASLALLFGLYQAAYETLIGVVALIVAVWVGVLVLRSRHQVAARLRAAPDVESSLARWRNWFAGAWHYLALLAIGAAWILWVAGIREGLGGVRILLGTVAILVVARLVSIALLGLMNRVLSLAPEPVQAKLNLADPAARYHRAGRFAVNAIVVVATGIVLLRFWGIGSFAWFESGRTGAQLISAAVTIAVALLAAIIVWEGANTGLERRLTRLSQAGSAAHSARLRTMLPILRAFLLSAIVTIVGLTALSEIGVNIAPLLAGAGIVGVALGFGSQKLVQDVITGIFVLFENAIQIGDTVTVAGLTGNVEQLSVRTIWLRGGDGAVHIIPFSAVTSITNTNRGLGNASVSVMVAFSEHSDRIIEVLSGIVTEMRESDIFGTLILGDLKVWVDTVKSNGVTYAGLIACTNSGRWPVQREFNRRMQLRFQELGIDLGKDA